MTRKPWLYPLLTIKKSSSDANRVAFSGSPGLFGAIWRHIYDATPRFQPFTDALRLVLCRPQR